MNKEARWLLKEKYAGAETPEFFADLKRLVAGEPLAYVIGWLDFLGCRIDLSLRPLIPRPETEFWVERVIRTWTSGFQVAWKPDVQVKILDLFAGSGCIGIALLKHLPSVRVDLGEKDTRLCKQIKKNIALNNIEPARARIIQTNMFSSVTDTYDYIFANPPYIDPKKRATVQPSALQHEPRGALFAKERGLYFIKKLLAKGSARLNNSGTMFIEFGAGERSAIARYARSCGWSATFTKDQFGKWRMVACTRA